MAMHQTTRRRAGGPSGSSITLASSSDVEEQNLSRQVRHRRKIRANNTVSPLVIFFILLIGSALIFVCAPLSKRRRRQRYYGNDAKKNVIPEGVVTIMPQQQQQQEQQVLEHTIQQQPAHDKEVITDNNDENTKNNNVLALIYPPGLMGGYRNQVIRLLSLCRTAQKRQINALLLPSLLWTTQVQVPIIDDANGTTKESWVPIPHDLIFDVDYWNEERKRLPLLVQDDDVSYNVSECWTRDMDSLLPSNDIATTTTPALTRQVLQRGFLTPIKELAADLATRRVVTNLRRLDVYPNVSHCQAPYVYGGGRGGAGRLWQDYTNAANDPNETKELASLSSELLRILRPKVEWRELAQSCVSQHISNNNNNNYIALHARMELEMMDHNCGQNMQHNLTTLLQQTATLAATTTTSSDEQADGIFVAVSRSGIDNLKMGALYEKFQKVADENIDVFNRVVGDEANGIKGEGLFASTAADNHDDDAKKKKIVAFECGKLLMDKYYANQQEVSKDSIDYGSLLQSVINFYIATESKAFVGVRGSSYSTDIWTTRYHLGKGGTNYEYTQTDGIILLENDGLPPMHTNCKKRNKV